MSIQPSRILAQCPLCQAAYREDEIRLVGERGASRLFHCNCEECGHSMLAIVLESSGWVSSVGLVTDLEAEEASRVQRSAPISVDECINLHRLLEGESNALCQSLLGIAHK